MYIIEKPFVSEYLIDTIINRDWPVLDNETIGACGLEEDVFNLWSSEEATEYYLNQEFPLIYSNSENAIEWVFENLPDSNLAGYIKAFKDKIAFRHMLKEIYPDFSYSSLEYLDINYVKKEDYTFPLVIKPSIGFLKSGVRIINEDTEWEKKVKSLHKEIATNKSMYSENVINPNYILIEEVIRGEDFSADAYYDQDGVPVILNIFKRLYKEGDPLNEKMYITTAQIVSEHLSQITSFLQQIGEKLNIRNFPLNVELRINEEGLLIPLEVNPMHFANWCVSDLAKYAWGFNVYEYFEKQQHPDWNTILQSAEEKTFYASLVDIPKGFPKSSVVDFNFNGYLDGFSNVLEVRHVNFKTNPLFGVILGSTTDNEELDMILNKEQGPFII